jgi:hypothetical protein
MDRGIHHRKGLLVAAIAMATIAVSWVKAGLGQFTAPRCSRRSPPRCSPLSPSLCFFVEFAEPRPEQESVPETSGIPASFRKEDQEHGEVSDADPIPPAAVVGWASVAHSQNHPYNERIASSAAVTARKRARRTFQEHSPKLSSPVSTVGTRLRVYPA